MKMEAILSLSQYFDWIIAIVSAGAGVMITYQAIRKLLSDDDAVIADCNAKIKRAIYGAIISLTIGGFIAIINDYYKDIATQIFGGQ